MDKKARKSAKTVFIQMAVVLLLVMITGLIVRIFAFDGSEPEAPKFLPAEGIELTEENIVF